MSKRIDLMLLEKTKYKDYQSTIENMKKLNLGTLYVSVNLMTLSETRAEMVNDDFTTRLFVAKINGQNHFYIYGKKKGKKGTFNQHCKNTFYEYDSREDFFTHIIKSSSNEKELFLSDCQEALEVGRKLTRDVEKYEK